MSLTSASRIMQLYSDLESREYGTGASGTTCYVSGDIITGLDGRFDTTGFLTCAALASVVGIPGTAKICGNFKGLGYNPSLYKRMLRMVGEKEGIPVQNNLGGMKVQSNTFMHITYSDGTVYVAANGQSTDETDIYGEIVAMVLGNFPEVPYDRIAILPFVQTNLDSGAEIVRMLTFSYDPETVLAKMESFHKASVETIEEDEMVFCELPIAYMFTN